MVLSIKIALIRRLYTHLTLVFDCIGYNPSLGDLNLWISCTGFAAPAAVGKRVDTCGFYPLNSRFPLFRSLAQTGDRRPLRNWNTAEDFFFRMFLNIFAVSDTVLLHIWFTLRRRNTRWIAQRAREGALGDNSVAQLVYTLLWTTPADSTLPTNFTAGCAKVNCPKGKRRSSGGYPCRATRWLVITDGTYEYNPLISFNNYP